jgi:hypothetical protein
VVDRGDSVRGCETVTWTRGRLEGPPPGGAGCGSVGRPQPGPLAQKRDAGRFRFAKAMHESGAEVFPRQ